MAKQKVVEPERPKVRSLYDILEGWDESPPPWRPVPGECLVGEVISYDTFSGRFGECKVCILREHTEGTLISVYLSSTVLLNEFKKLRPKIGEAVGIRYLGKSGDDDDGYHKYRVVVDREMNVDEFFGMTPSPKPFSTDLAGIDDVPL